MRTQAREAGKTATKILDVAEKLVQTQGFNAFSYADIADEIRVRKASLHHHFATKSELVESLVERYEERFMGALKSIESSQASAAEKLSRYIDIYSGVLRKNRMCLCGILAAEYATLPKGVRESVTRFFASVEAWLARLLEDGRKSGGLTFSGGALDTARFLVSSLEGAMIIARAQKDFARFDSVAARLLSMLVANN